MEFPDYDFRKLNETDVREEIIAPLLRYLGYRSGTEHNIIREQALSYPKEFLGRKKSNDPVLRGRADYICEAYGNIRWVIEAKSPDCELDRDAEEQSWSYANHPAIRAVYFCLMNGKELKIFQTSRGPEVSPVFECSYSDLEQSLNAIENMLSPASMLRDNPHQEVDTGASIGPGLRSIARIASGHIIYHKSSLNLPFLTGMTMSISNGSVERNEEGKLEAYLEAMVPFQSLQKLNEKLGLNILRMCSESETVSCDPGSPTVFTSSSDRILPKGEFVLDLATWTETQIPMNINVNIQTSASGYLEENNYQGEFSALLSYKEIPMEISLEGEYSMRLV